MARRHGITDSKHVGQANHLVPYKYDPCFAQDLIKHFSGGGTPKTFGAYLYERYGQGFLVPEAMIAEWVIEHEDFRRAFDTGYSLSLKYWIELGRDGIAGKLTRQYKEEPVEGAVDKNGKHLLRKTYIPARFNGLAWVFLMKNLFRWADRVTIDDGAGRSPIHPKLSAVEDKDLAILKAILSKGETIDVEQTLEDQQEAANGPAVDV
jgi:hypothetical protein